MIGISRADGRPCAQASPLAPPFPGRRWTVPTPRSLLCVGLVAGLLLAAPEAEARFGKRSKSSSSSDSSNKGKVHDATPVGQDSDDDDEDDDGGSGSGSGSYSGGSSYTLVDFFVGMFVNTGSRHSTYVAAPEPDMQTGAAYDTTPARSIFLRMGLDGGTMGGGSNIGFFLGMEGERFGIYGRATGITLPTDDGSAGTDGIGLFEANLTYSLWASERGRFRLEGGLSGANAPDITFLGINLAASLEACLAGPLDFEARIQAVPVPYRQVDAQLGLALHLGSISLRGGWRGMVLDDAGHVDGVRHVDAFSGPYLGAGIIF